MYRDTLAHPGWMQALTILLIALVIARAVTVWPGDARQDTLIAPSPDPETAIDTPITHIYQHITPYAGKSQMRTELLI